MWEDPYVGDERDRFITSGQCERVTWVKDLIDPKKLEWNWALIEEIFNE